MSGNEFSSLPWVKSESYSAKNEFPSSENVCDTQIHFKTFRSDAKYWRCENFVIKVKILIFFAFASRSPPHCVVCRHPNSLKRGKSLDTSLFRIHGKKRRKQDKHFHGQSGKNLRCINPWINNEQRWVCRVLCRVTFNWKFQTPNTKQRRSLSCEMLIVDSCGSYTDFIASPLVIYSPNSTQWARRVSPWRHQSALNVYSLERLFSSRHETAKNVFTHFDGEFQRRIYFLEEVVERDEKRELFYPSHNALQGFRKENFQQVSTLCLEPPQSQHSLSFSRFLSLSLIHAPTCLLFPP